MTTTTSHGSLYLIPVPLSTSGSMQHTLSVTDVTLVQGLEYFLVENAKTARAFLKTLPLTKSLQSLQIAQIDKHHPDERLDQALAPLLQGFDMGLMSEAGCPAVADAGASAVAWAQNNSCPVIPLVGPSALILALMASGLNGQSFAFNGYLPAESVDRKKALKRLEDRSMLENQTQQAIETPYRARAWFQDAIATFAPQTRLSLAIDLSLPEGQCITRTVQQWRVSAHANGAIADHRLVVFSWLAQRRH
jgi:16S rRNA (cytidine1402-2'-O)-methyltransferase